MKARFRIKWYFEHISGKLELRHTIEPINEEAEEMEDAYWEAKCRAGFR